MDSKIDRPRIRFWHNFAEVPGAIILLLLTIFQFTIVTETSRNEMMSRTYHLENIIVSICGRISNLEVVTDQSDRTDIRRDCVFYDDVKARSESPTHWTWVEAGEIFSYAQLVVFLIGALGFVGGVTYRMWRLFR